MPSKGLSISERLSLTIYLKPSNPDFSYQNLLEKITYIQHHHLVPTFCSTLHSLPPSPNQNFFSPLLTSPIHISQPIFSRPSIPKFKPQLHSLNAY